MVQRMNGWSDGRTRRPRSGTTFSLVHMVISACAMWRTHVVMSADVVRSRPTVRARPPMSAPRGGCASGREAVAPQRLEPQRSPLVAGGGAAPVSGRRRRHAEQVAGVAGSVGPRAGLWQAGAPELSHVRSLSSIACAHGQPLREHAQSHDQTRVHQALLALIGVMPCGIRRCASRRKTPQGGPKRFGDFVRRA